MLGVLDIVTSEQVFLPRSRASKLDPFLLGIFETNKTKVGVILSINNLLPAIYQLLWDIVFLCRPSSLLFDLKDTLSHSAWKSLFGDNFLVSETFESFTKKIHDLDALILISETNNFLRSSEQDLIEAPIIHLAFPPFPNENELLEIVTGSTDSIFTTQLPPSDDLSSSVFACIARNKYNGPLRNKRVLVTAGPTQGPIDAVRFISSTSSGALGSRIADYLYLSSCKVETLLGKGSTMKPSFAPFSWIRTPEELLHIVQEKVKESEIVIFAAAVLDYIPKTPKTFKTPSGLQEWSIELQQTPKIIKMIRKTNPESIVVGFKLLVNVSNENLLEEGKLRLKEADILVVNDLNKVGTHHHEAIILTQDCAKKAINKDQIARIIKVELETILQSR